MLMVDAKIIYGFDPLCGWCYGFVPAMRLLRKTLPNLDIELALGGMVAGTRIGPYAEMRAYIESASQRLFMVTGRKPSEKFHANILCNKKILASSIEPSIAIKAVRDREPIKTLDFAHDVIEAHFQEGRDLNDQNLYLELAKKNQIDLDLQLVSAPAQIKDIEAEFKRSASFGINSFPTVLIGHSSSKKMEKLQTQYDPEKFVGSLIGAIQGFDT